MPVQVISNAMHVVALHWYCDFHIHGSNGNALGMVQRLFRQLINLLLLCDLDRRARFSSRVMQRPASTDSLIINKRTALVCIVVRIAFDERS